MRTVTFLAAGEYNENYLVESGDNRYVFRINHGTQLGLSNQIEYEFSVLKAVQESGVTPRPFFVDGNTHEFGKGVLLMEYIPGKSFDYHRDWEAAADVFARIHRLPTPDHLVTQVKPISSLVAESIYLLNRFDPRPVSDIARRIRIYGREIESLAERHDGQFAAETPCIVNTEVNSGNFIVGLDRVVLVDWEKAVVSCRYQDLGHFLVPTTTLWKTDFAFSPDQRRSFLSAYHSRLAVDTSLDELDESTALLEKTILLRAYSWCFMAYAEYTSNRRPLMNRDTFKKINYYLDHTFDFLGV